LKTHGKSRFHIEGFRGEGEMNGVRALVAVGENRDSFCRINLPLLGYRLRKRSNMGVSSRFNQLEVILFLRAGGYAEESRPRFRPPFIA